MIPAEDSSPAQLLEAADRQLYQAKKTGRNRIVALTHETLLSECNTGA